MRLPRPRTRWGVLALLYLAVLLWSYTVWATRSPQRYIRSNQDTLRILYSFREKARARPVRIAYRELPADSPGAPTILLLHGSPVGGRTFGRMAPHFTGAYRVIIPDMAGFDGSSRRVPDYGMEAQAALMLRLMEGIGTERFHVVGYSFGGGVGIVMAHKAPERVQSLVLLSSIGAQELELLGDYYVNHMLHGASVAGLGLLTYAFPHFGAMNGFILNMGFARSFYDSDQRPLRGFLEELEIPTLILHGRSDVLVPPQTAEEHHRIVPQSEITWYEGGHGLVFRIPDQIVGELEGWVARVEEGEAPIRAQADPERVRVATLPFDVLGTVPLSGPLLGSIVLLIVVGTLISEDLTCIAAGLLAARGSLSLLAAVSASFIGILLGDILLYGAGRWIGRPAVDRAPFRWFIRASQLERSREWMERKNPVIILSSRFVPGARLPTYFGAGVLRANFSAFFFYCGVAGAIWTPLLAGVAYLAGGQAWRYYATYSGNALLSLVLTIILLYVGLRLVLVVATPRGQRRLRMRMARWTRWEFWPPWAAYAPLLPYLLYLGLRHRSLTLFTATNPAMPLGGFVGESKSRILSALGEGPVARFRLLPGGEGGDKVIELVEKTMAEWGVDYPVVLKPDVGERGRGVAVVRSRDATRRYLEGAEAPLILQEYVGGLEFGVFYYRIPWEERGHIFSITRKKPTCVRGDGASRLEDLILRDPRASFQAPVHLEQNRHRLDWVPGKGEAVPLTELGTHCRGSLFLDGNGLWSEALEEAVDEISRPYRGFFFGRYDMRVPSEEDLAAGRKLTVIELNGVTSEATHVYDPALRMREAYRVLFRQWGLAFRIGAMNRARGHEPASLRELCGALLHHYHGDDPTLPDSTSGEVE